MNDRITYDQWQTSYGPPEPDIIAAIAAGVAEGRYPLQLRDWRKFWGLTLQDVAAIIGVEASTLNRYEGGQMYPKYTTIIKLALIYNVSPEELLAAPAGYTSS
jgi:DNA-binding XRE family transcriptional regulator